MDSSNSGSSSDEDDRKVGFWSDWVPSSIPALDQIKSKCSIKRSREKMRPSITSFTFSTDDPKFGTWIPPGKLLRPLKATRAKQCHSEKETLFCESTNCPITEELPEATQSFVRNAAVLRKELILHWGQRVQLHDVTKFNDGDLVWGIVNSGIFANIRLWVNEYGNICGLADGKISKLGSSEMTFISINSTHLLRKMLHLSTAQWSSLCETLLETKTILKFDAFEVSELKRKTSLEKLWFFICKRRHFLPNQGMLVKLCGAVKCLRQFKINTKLMVQDIRTLIGEPTGE